MFVARKIGAIDIGNYSLEVTLPHVPKLSNQFFIIPPFSLFSLQFSL